VQRPLTNGPRGWPTGQSPSQPARFYVGLVRNFVHTCLHVKGKAKAVGKVGGGRTTWLTSQVARPVGHHFVSYRLNQVGNPLLGPL
jgi:hypothetical protein